MKFIITGACAVSARSVLRSLKLSNLFKDSQFIGWDIADNLYGLYEGLFNRIYKVPGVQDESYREIIEKILNEEKPDAVIVVPEIEVLYWSRNPFNVPHLVPPVDFCELAISKRKLFNLLKNSELVPESYEIEKIKILSKDFVAPLSYPLWIRDSSANTASGKGSFAANNMDELKAWVKINTGIEQFQLSQFLPGSNYGCFCLFYKGELIKIGIAERINYLMAKVAVSGITGNTSKGRLLNDDTIKNVALDVIDRVAKHTNTKMHGLVVVDMKCDENNKPKVTEINIRHVAFSSSFANAGFNLSEAHLLCTLDRVDELNPEIEKKYPQNNLLLRDVDGLPIYVEDYTPIKIGEYASSYNET